MTPAALLASLRTRGVTLSARPGEPATLLARPREALTPDDRDWIGLHKVALLLLLEGIDPDDFATWRAAPFLADPPRPQPKADAKPKAVPRRARRSMFEAA
jgi:hypothetical protein